MFKIGEKYRCKEPVYFLKHTMFKDTYYQIASIDDKYIAIYFSEDFYIIFESDPSSKTKIPNVPNFQEHFYSKSEERKFKLEKLRED